MSTVKATNFSHPSAANPAIVLDAAGGATVAGMGLVLVSPTSIANSGGSASASGGAVTFTGVSSVSLNGVFTSAYENYKIMTQVNFSDANYIWLFARMRAAGTDATGSTYYSQRILGDASTPYATLYSNDTGMRLGQNYTNNGTFSAELFKPQLAEDTTFLSQNVGAGPAPFTIFVAGIHDTATAYDGITFYAGSGTITGKVRIYGFKNS